MAKTLRRPTKEMMLAVNASIAGNKKKVNDLVKEHRLGRRELDARLEIRDGEKYQLRRKAAPATIEPKVRAAKLTDGPVDEVLGIINRRTNIVTLVRLEGRAQELLAQKRKAEVNKVRKAMAEVEVLRQKYEEAKAALGM